MEEKPLHEQQAQGYGIAQATGGSSATVTIYQAPAKPGDPHRQQMLAKVRAFWISGVLEQSLHGAAPLVLRLQEQPDMLVNPWAWSCRSPPGRHTRSRLTSLSCRSMMRPGGNCSFSGRPARARRPCYCSWLVTSSIAPSGRRAIPSQSCSTCPPGR